jgi:uncharacterized protein YecT (DUF1311 family)
MRKSGMTLFARIRIAAACLIATAAGASLAHAAQGECLDGQSSREITLCYTKLLNQADADMKAKYQDLEAPVKHLSVIEAQLTKSQEDWVAYRDQACELVRLHWLEGDLETVNVLNCKLTLTRERTSDLDNMFRPLFGAAKQ